MITLERLMAGSSVLFSAVLIPSMAVLPVPLGIRLEAVRVFMAAISRPFSVMTCFFANQRAR